MVEIKIKELNLNFNKLRSALDKKKEQGNWYPAQSGPPPQKFWKMKIR